MGHTPIILGGRFSGSVTLIANHPGPRAAVILVHGFTGDAVATWHDFQSLVQRPEEEWWASKDIFFFGYKHIGEALDFQKQLLMDFIADVYPKPNPKTLFPEATDSSIGSYLRDLGRALPASYSDLFVVGHSQGCVVIRLAMLDYATLYDIGLSGEIDQYLIMTAANVRLFAPVHSGFRPIRTFKALLYHFCQRSPKLRWISTLLKTSVNHEELREGSSKLSELRRRTEKFAEKYATMQGLRAHMVFGQGEEWVVEERFDCDPPYRLIAERDHVSLCKPSPTYLFPLRFVQDGYKAKATGTSA